jgi:hypothetical protein
MRFEQILYSLFGVLIILLVIGLLWALLWKLILEPNPVVRDFFDLDRKDTPKRRE